uniref:Uncharacterized protein n=1 Tax=Tanacetum cinerariifolium TaxID=118510 RepID=A0A699HFF7_TANCI|nr:hypothetical protein [Tanacetum cinerariifolium]GEY03349.1 hypothetical protein [Tanacetum cinerariifolium]
MEPLPHHDLRHPWLKYQVDRYDKGIIHSYEHRLEMIWGRPVNRVDVLDFSGLTDGIRQTLRDRLSMVYVGDDGEALFTSHAWRRLFERQFNLALGLHSEEEMAEPGFGASWSGTHYLFHYAEGRKSGSRLFGCHFIGHLAAHFGLVGDQGLRGLSMVAWVALGPERQQADAASAPRVVEGALAVDEGALAANEGAQAVPAPVQHPCRQLTTILERRVRPRTGDANTFAAPQTDDKPDP